MSKQKSLSIIMVLSGVGTLFAGYLSYTELFAGECGVGVVSCGVATPPIMGLPACVYGFAMFLVVFIISLLGRNSKS